MTRSPGSAWKHPRPINAEDWPRSFSNVSNPCSQLTIVRCRPRIQRHTRGGSAAPAAVASRFVCHVHHSSVQDCVREAR
eukprot:scaffold1277_cov253-Pinguiococcus_pyrenoidosus.AAC.29